MNITLNTIASFASIISIPLSIYLYLKTKNISCDKAKNDILKTLWYRLSNNNNLTQAELKAVYKSKLREHKIRHPNFTINDLIDDLSSEIMSNPFVNINNINIIINNLSDLYYSIPEPWYTRNRFLRPIYQLLNSPLPIFFIIFFASNVILGLIDKSSHIYALQNYINENALDSWLDAFIYIIKQDEIMCISIYGLIISAIIYFIFYKYIKKYLKY